MEARFFKRTGSTSALVKAITSLLRFKGRDADPAPSRGEYQELAVLYSSEEALTVLHEAPLPHLV